MSQKAKKTNDQPHGKGGNSPGKGRFWPVLAVFLLAVLVRGLYLYDSSDNPTFSAPVVDAMTYDQMARQIVADQTFKSKFFWQPIFYPVFLSGVYMLSNSSILCVRILQVLLGSVTCVLVYRLGDRTFGKNGGILAGIICAVYMPLVFFEGELLATGWAAFWAIAAILALLRAKENPTLINCLAFGLVCALTIVTRPAFLPFIATGCIWLIIALIRRRIGTARFILSLGTAAAGFFIIAVPVMLLNRGATGKATILPYSGGINLYIGNNPDYKETITTRPGRPWKELAELPIKHGLSIDDRYGSQQFFFDKTTDYITSEPLSFLKGLCYKTAQFVSPREMPRNIDIYQFRKWSGMLRVGVFKIGRFGFPFGLLLPLALVGGFCWRRKIAAPIWLLVLFYPASVILVFVTSRYRVPIVPVISVLAAGGCLAIWQFIKQHQPKKLAATAAAIAGIAVATGLAGPFYAEQIDLEPELYCGLGDSLEKQGRPAEAIEAYSKAIALRQTYAEAYHGLGNVYVKQGKFKKAVEQYSQSLKYEPGHAETLNNMANALLNLKRLPEAVEKYRQAIEAAPDIADTYINLGLCLKQLNRVDEAVEAYNKALQIDPTSKNIHDKLGAAYFATGQMSKAAEHYYKAVALEPDKASLYYNLGAVYSAQGEYEKAVEYYEKSLELKPNDPETLTNMAYALGILERFPEAAEKYRMALKLIPDDAGLYCQLGICLVRQGKVDEAIEAYEKAIRIDPQHDLAGKSLKYLRRQSGQ
ncbi:MAG: tetratricopeptide repeat protein [Planctomycetota bacterium]|jgi:tetratricopeptide (TPR) repeat protein